MNRTDLLTEIKKLSFLDLLSLYVEAKSGEPKNLDSELSSMDWERVNRVEEIIAEITDPGTEPEG